MLLLLLRGGGTQTPDTSEDVPPMNLFVDRLVPRVVTNIHKDDEEVLLMFAQFVASRQVH